MFSKEKRKQQMNMLRGLRRLERGFNKIEKGQKVGTPELHALIVRLRKAKQKRNLYIIDKKLSQLERRAINALANYCNRN